VRLDHAIAGARGPYGGARRITEFKTAFAQTTILFAAGAARNAVGALLNNPIEAREPGR